MKRIFIPLLTLLTPITALASTSLATLNVDGDVALFTTAEAKTHEIPSCVDQSRKQEWAVSLNTTSGKAIFALLVAAYSDNRNVTITSANDCADVNGYERAQSIAVSPAQISSASNIYLYKADGQTVVGRFIERDGIKVNSFWYLSAENSQELKLYTPFGAYQELSFKTTDCTGTPYISTNNKVGRNDYFHGGTFFISNSSTNDRGRKSTLDRFGKCTSDVFSNAPMYEVDVTYEDPVCGQNLCQLKEAN